LLFDCLVAVTEACTNALIHGRHHPEDDPAPVLAWSVDAHKARFHIEDYSTEGWSRVRHPSRTATVTRVEDLQIGGLGLDMMRELMDEIDIEKAQGGTSVYMTKVLGGRDPVIA
jgi:serine/threonine-protein kinase RsbW